VPDGPLEGTGVAATASQTQIKAIIKWSSCGCNSGRARTGGLSSSAAVDGGEATESFDRSAHRWVVDRFPPIGLMDFQTTRSADPRTRGTAERHVTCMTSHQNLSVKIRRMAAESSPVAMSVIVVGRLFEQRLMTRLR